MKLFILFLLLHNINTEPYNYIPDPEKLRINYSLAPEDKSLCRSMLKELNTPSLPDLHLAYLGAFQMIWAKHTPNPFEKLSSFNKGKNNIEKALKNDPENVEIIFLRYSLQKNSPAFLGYNDNLDDDKKFLKLNIHKSPSPDVRKMIENIIN